MGLKNDLQSDIAEAFNTDLNDAVSDFTYSEINSVFDPNTNTTSTVNIDYASRGVFGKFKREVLRDTSVLATDTKLVILQNELAVEPLKNMKIITDTLTYTIIKVKHDPTNAIWVLHCRE